MTKTAGPARLSLADRGLTFATNPDAGLCIRFAEPVAAFDPFGRIRHPGITVTVERLDGLQRQLTSPSTTGAEENSDGVPAESPGTIAARWARWPLGMLLVTARYLRSLGDIDRAFELRHSPAPEVFEPTDGTEVQGVNDGVGPVFERTYRVRIADSTHTPEQLLGFVASNFNRAAPVEVAEFSERRPKGDGPGSGLGVRDSDARTLERIGSDRGQDSDVDPPGDPRHRHMEAGRDRVPNVLGRFVIRQR